MAHNALALEGSVTVLLERRGPRQRSIDSLYRECVSMRDTNHLQELRHLTKQADAQVSTQLQLIDRLMRAKLPSDDAREALTSLRRVAAALHGRLKVLTST